MWKNFRVPFCLKLSKASYANFRKSILDREWIVIKITFNLLKSSKSKNHRIKEFYFHEDEPVARTIFSSRGSAVSIDLESRLTHSLVLFSAKQQWQGYFFFLFFFLLARDRPPTHVLIKTLCSEPNYHPTSNSNLLFTWTPIISALNRLRKLITPIRSRTILTYPIDSDFLARGFEIIFGWKRVENIWS